MKYFFTKFYIGNGYVYLGDDKGTGCGLAPLNQNDREFQCFCSMIRALHGDARNHGQNYVPIVIERLTPMANCPVRVSTGNRCFVLRFVPRDTDNAWYGDFEDIETKEVVE